MDGASSICVGGNGPRSRAIQLSVSLNLQQELLKKKSTPNVLAGCRQQTFLQDVSLVGQLTLGVGRTELASLLLGEQHQGHIAGREMAPLESYTIQ